MTNLWPWFVLFGSGSAPWDQSGDGLALCGLPGLQERRRKAVLAALPPIALGHALSVGLVVALLALLRARLSASVLQYVCAALLVGYGLYRAGARSTSAVGRDARWISGPDSLVVPYGIGAWRGPDVDSCLFGDGLTGFPRCDRPSEQRR